MFGIYIGVAILLFSLLFVGGVALMIIDDNYTSESWNFIFWGSVGISVIWPFVVAVLAIAVGFLAVFCAHALLIMLVGKILDQN